MKYFLGLSLERNILFRIFSPCCLPNFNARSPPSIQFSGRFRRSQLFLVRQLRCRHPLLLFIGRRRRCSKLDVWHRRGRPRRRWRFRHILRAALQIFIPRGRNRLILIWRTQSILNLVIFSGQQQWPDWLKDLIWLNFLVILHFSHKWQVGK